MIRARIHDLFVTKAVLDVDNDAERVERRHQQRLVVAHRRHEQHKNHRLPSRTRRATGGDPTFLPLLSQLEM